MLSVSEAALQLHQDALVIDLHADTLEMVAVGYDVTKKHNPMAIIASYLGHADLPRLRSGGVSAQFFGIVIPPWAKRKGALKKIAKQSQRLDHICENNPEAICRAFTADEVLDAHGEGKLAAFLGVEGSYGIAGHTQALDELVKRQVRYMGPAHIFDHYPAPSNMAGPEREFNDEGRELIFELRSRSIIVDLAHMARVPFLEICEGSEMPVIVSHTGLAGVKPHWRNIDDEQIRSVAQTGGVVGVIMTPRFLGQPGVQGIMAHIDHLIEVGGEDIAALGSDFDGLIRPPKDVKDAAGLPLITQAMLEKSYSEGRIRKVLGENMLRVLREFS